MPRATQKTQPSSETVLTALWPDAEQIPSKLLECRHCGKRNKIQVSAAVLSPGSCECGACGEALFLSPKERLERISSSAYEHWLDRTALEALKSLPGFPALMRWLLSTVGERGMRLANMSNSILCGEDQFPELLKLMDQARHRLDIPYQPALFLSESPFLNASTFGVEDPIIIVKGALLDHLDDPQVMAVLGHELGHLHADHCLYSSLASVLASGSAALGAIGKLLTWPLQKALLKWSRCAELTADRAGLLACQDLEAYLQLLMTMAGGNRPGVKGRTQMQLAPFIRQARSLAEMESSSWLDGAMATLMTLDSSHPFIAWRVMHLLEWVEHGNYLEILAGRYARVTRPAAA